MSARRQQPIGDEALWLDGAEARTGGIGLDFAKVPSLLDRSARAEWRRLADVFADDATRFREGDRAALTAYCVFFSAFTRAAADVGKRGTTVPGRSNSDADRMVKNPNVQAMRDAATQLRYWARELGLTPDARGRMGIKDEVEDDDDNIFG